MKQATIAITLAYSLILVAIIGGQLLWLPAPVFNTTMVEWIAVINGLYFSVLLIPLLFIITQGLLLRYVKKLNKINDSYTLLLAVSVIIFGYSVYAMIQFLFIHAIVCILIIVLITTVLYLVVNKKHNYNPFKRIVVSTILYGIALFILICPIPYNVTHPFFTFKLNNYATIIQSDEHAQSNRHEGSVSGVLVAERPAFVADLLYAQWFKAITLEKRTTAQLPITEIYSQVVTQKINSNKLAEAYAWQRYSHEEAIHPIGVTITGILEQSAVKDDIVAGERIVSINDESTLTLQQLATVMANVKVGEKISVELENMSGEQRVVETVTYAAEKDENKAILGIYIEQAVNIEDVLDVNYKHYVAHFGGPSHGAMLTIALLDQLYEGELVKNLHIAGTGTIEVDGSIGMVGGVEQKAYAVSRSQADVFFVPEAAYSEAIKGAPQLNIVAVNHIDDIINWLTEHEKE